MKPQSLLAVIMLVVIILLSTFLRAHNYATWPRHGATFDEFAWTWLGMSILTSGVPESWSYHPQYRKKSPVKIQGSDFILVRPYLEHPPIFGLVAGSFALLTGAREYADVRLSTIRVLPLFLGVISVVLVYLLARALYTTPTGLLAALIYGIMPTSAVGSRLLQNENFFIPVWLSMLLLLKKYLDTKKPFYRVLLGVLGGLLILSKIPWVAGILSVSAVLWFNKRQKDAWFTFAISISIGLMYVVYGFMLDGNVFSGLMGLQLNRYDITFLGPFSLWLKPLITDRFYIDGWIYFGWFALFLLGANLKKHQILIFSVLAYGCIYILGIPDEAGHGWYRYPFYPFLAISSAFVIREFVWQSYVYRALGLLAIGLPLLASTWGASYGFSYGLYRGFIVASLLSFLPVAFPNKQTEKFADAVFVVLGIVILFLTIWSVVGYNEQ